MNKEQQHQKTNNETPNPIEKGILFTLEGADKPLLNKISTILETALKYEFDNKKFVIINSFNANIISSKIAQLFNNKLSKSTNLLLLTAIIKEANDEIDKYINSGYNVICTSYITNYIILLSKLYSMTDLVLFMNTNNVFNDIESEIVILNPYNEICKIDKNLFNNQYADYKLFIDEASKNKDNIHTKYHKIETSYNDLDNCIKEIVSALKSGFHRNSLINEVNKVLTNYEGKGEKDHPVSNK